MFQISQVFLCVSSRAARKGGSGAQPPNTFIFAPKHLTTQNMNLSLGGDQDAALTHSWPDGMSASEPVIPGCMSEAWWWCVSFCPCVCGHFDVHKHGSWLRVIPSAVSSGAWGGRAQDKVTRAKRHLTTLIRQGANLPVPPGRERVMHLLWGHCGRWWMAARAFPALIRRCSLDLISVWPPLTRTRKYLL